VVGSWQTREGHGEDAMKSPLLPFSQRLCHVYCACTTFMEMLRRLSHDLHDHTAFSRSMSDRRTLAFVLNRLKTSAVTRRSLATMATTARCLPFPPRLYHAYGDLDALWAHFPSP
jgi:hypothetical protein